MLWWVWNFKLNQRRHRRRILYVILFPLISEQNEKVNSQYTIKRNTINNWPPAIKWASVSCGAKANGFYFQWRPRRVVTSFNSEGGWGRAPVPGLVLIPYLINNLNNQSRATSSLGKNFNHKLASSCSARQVQLAWNAKVTAFHFVPFVKYTWSFLSLGENDYEHIGI